MDHLDGGRFAAEEPANAHLPIVENTDTGPRKIDVGRSNLREVLWRRFLLFLVRHGVRSKRGGA
ncbi:MAG: hypothetical protein DRJ42_23130 [Deltaproteobacteria bacterium]|nr:MAG: hypothetical protein DRJ42_23130 [Deltaproteobacteria bacterium]